MFEYLLRSRSAADPGPPWELAPSRQAATLWSLGEARDGLAEPPDPFPDVEARLSRGELVLFRRRIELAGVQASSADAQEPVDLSELSDVLEPSEAEDEPELPPPEPARPTWIEITVVDGENAPIEGRPYVLTLWDGTRREGTLDATGVIRFDDVEAGLCSLLLPTADETEWAPHG